MFSLKASVVPAQRYLRLLRDEEIPFATAIGLTKTAKDVQAAEIDEMGRVFDRPTPFALRGTFVKPATPKSQEAKVWLKDGDQARNQFSAPLLNGLPGKIGTPAVKFLAPHVYGGGRNLKSFEKKLQLVGLMPKGMYAVPGSRARIDAAGNMSRTQIIQVMSVLQALSVTAGSDQNETFRSREKKKRRRKVVDYFVGRPGNGTGPLGVWQRVGNGARPILIFVKPPVYRQRFGFFEVADREAGRAFAMNVRDAVYRQLLRRSRLSGHAIAA